MTYLMPGTVRLVSATLVASTIRRPVWPANTRCCFGYRQSGVERQDLSMPQVERGQCLGGIANFALAGEEHENVARPLGLQLDRGLADSLDLIARFGVVGRRRGARSRRADRSRVAPARRRGSSASGGSGSSGW